MWLWLLSNPGRLQPDPLRQLRNTKNELLLSAASSWEISVKYRLGKLALPEPPDTFVPSRLRTTGTTPIPIEQAHTLAAIGLPLHHRDPFDRLLIAQSMVLKVPLVTADPQFEPYEIETIFT